MFGIVHFHAFLKEKHPEVLLTHAKLVCAGWKFKITDNVRGMCHYGKQEITLPEWIFKRDDGYKTWYFCHEMAHALAPLNSNHGPEFMKTLRNICPEIYLHHELGYKPRNGAAAGIVHIAEDF